MQAHPAPQGGTPRLALTQRAGRSNLLPISLHWGDPEGVLPDDLVFDRSVAVEGIRLAIVSTPRTGNCWLRHMLAQMLELQEIIVHLPSEVPWHDLLPRAIVQLHWLPDQAFTSLLEEHGFRVVVNCRHPLDVLVSILAFSQHDESTRRWLGGAEEDERVIQGASPLSEAFLHYARGPRAASLLSVSHSWWTIPGVIRVRYEDLMNDAAGQLERILAKLDVEPCKSPADVADHSTPDLMRNQNVHMLYHVWQAQSGLWKRFITPERARRICESHAKTLITLGYDCDADEMLTTEAAAAAWERFDAAALKRNLFGVKRELCEVHARHHQQQHEVRETLERQRRELEQQCAELEQLRLYLEQHRLNLEQVRHQLAEVPFDQLRELQQLGPWSLGTACALNRWSGRFPRAAAGFKSVLRMLRPSGSRGRAA